MSDLASGGPASNLVHALDATEDAFFKSLLVEKDVSNTSSLRSCLAWFNEDPSGFLPGAPEFRYPTNSLFDFCDDDENLPETAVRTACNRVCIRQPGRIVVGRWVLMLLESARDKMGSFWMIMSEEAEAANINTARRVDPYGGPDRPPLHYLIKCDGSSALQMESQMQEMMFLLDNSKVAMIKFIDPGSSAVDDDDWYEAADLFGRLAFVLGVTEGPPLQGGANFRELVRAGMHPNLRVDGVTVNPNGRG